MRSRPEGPATRRQLQSGFSLLEVMFASMILSAFILGVGGFWYSASSRAADLVLRQKAIFVLNAEMERISALYVFTGFATSSFNDPVSTTGYDGLAALQVTRLIYPSNVGSFASSDYVTTSAATFSSSEFHVLLKTNAFTSLNRAYVWIDKNRSIVGRLSWVTTNIAVASCIQAADCSCQRYDDLSWNGGRCQKLDVYLEYPYRFDSSGTVAAPAILETLSISTIVGRG